MDFATPRITSSVSYGISVTIYFQKWNLLTFDANPKQHDRIQERPNLTARPGLQMIPSGQLCYAYYIEPCCEIQEISALGIFYVFYVFVSFSTLCAFNPAFTAKKPSYLPFLLRNKNLRVLSTSSRYNERDGYNKPCWNKYSI